MTTRSITAASADGNKSTLFFINENGDITIYQAQEQNERPRNKGGPKYIEGFAYPANADPKTSEPLKTGGKDLAAIAYYDDVGSRVCTRLYYVDTSSILKELCKDGDGQWYDGDLGRQNVSVDRDTPLAAMEAFLTDPVTQKDVKQLKVYYFRPGGRVNVAWATINTGDWQVNKEVS